MKAIGVQLLYCINRIVLPIFYFDISVAARIVAPAPAFFSDQHQRAPSREKKNTPYHHTFQHTPDYPQHSIHQHPHCHTPTTRPPPPLSCIAPVEQRTTPRYHNAPPLLDQGALQPLATSMMNFANPQQTPMRPLPGQFINTPAPGAMRQPSFGSNPPPAFRLPSQQAVPQRQAASTTQSQPVNQQSQQQTGMAAPSAFAPRDLSPVELAKTAINEKLEAEGRFPPLEDYIGRTLLAYFRRLNGRLTLNRGDISRLPNGLSCLGALPKDKTIRDPRPDNGTD